MYKLIRSVITGKGAENVNISIKWRIKAFMNGKKKFYFEKKVSILIRFVPLPQMIYFKEMGQWQIRVWDIM